VDDELQGHQVMQAAAQHMRLVTCLATQGDKAGFYRAFIEAEPLFDDANAVVGDVPYPGKEKQAHQDYHPQNDQYNCFNHMNLYWMMYVHPLDSYERNGNELYNRRWLMEIWKLNGNRRLIETKTGRKPVRREFTAKYLIWRWSAYYKHRRVRSR